MSLNTTYFETKGRDVTNPIPETPSYVPPTPPTPPGPDPGSVPVIPRPVFSGNVECRLYINDCDKFVMHKDERLQEVFSDTIAIKEITSVKNPQIIVKTSTNLLEVNYMKLGDYYYYVTVEMLPGGDRYQITGVRDALTSFKDYLLNLNVIVDKNEYDVNPYLDDGSYIVEERQQIETIQYSQGFNDSGSYILIAAGG